MKKYTEDEYNSIAKDIRGRIEGLYSELAKVIEPDWDKLDLNTDEGNHEASIQLSAGVTALFTVFTATVKTLTSKMPKDLGHPIRLSATQLITDLQKGMSASLILAEHDNVKLKEPTLH